MDGIEGKLIGGRELVARFERYTPRVRDNVRAAIQRMQITLQRTIKVNYLQGSPLHIRSGLLSNSIAVRPLEESDTQIRGPVGTNTVYGPIHEFGGTITPKTAQFLTIPLEAALTAAKVLRFTARQIISSPESGGYTGTFFRKGVLFGTEAGGGITPLFALKSSVSIPARPFMHPALTAVKPEYDTALTQALEKAKAEAGFK